MNFNAKLFINDYYENKINEIDLNCENAILETQQEDLHQILNQVRLNLVDHIKSAREEVLKRFNKLGLNDGIALTNEIKNEIFSDKYCYILDFEKRKYLIPKMVDSKEIGVLIFSEYNDELLDNLRYYFNEKHFLKKLIIKNNFYKILKMHGQRNILSYDSCEC